MLVDSGGENLLEAALSAGFGSYAQFHRVFRTWRSTTPREYLQERRQPIDGRSAGTDFASRGAMRPRCGPASATALGTRSR